MKILSLIIIVLLNFSNVLNAAIYNPQSLFIDTNDDEATKKIIESFSNGEDVSIIEKLLE